MDIRGTLAANESFIEKLKTCYSSKEKISIILDNGGLERAGGVIKEIYFDAQPPSIELSDGTKINVHTIVALNGTFLPEYTEC